MYKLDSALWAHLYKDWSDYYTSSGASYILHQSLATDCLYLILQIEFVIV